MYVSEFTRFLDDLKAQRPGLVAEQKKSRAIWWDKKPQTAEERDEAKASRVQQGPYVYQTKLK